jgi:hypothetical protein
MAETPTQAVYDPTDPANHPAAGPPPADTWIEGDHPTANPDGVTNSNHDYYPKTQEEKAELLDVPFAPSVDNVVDIQPTEPYPTGNPPDLRQAVLDQAHTKQEQVEEKDRIRQDVESLRAGGSLASGAPVA